MIHLSKLSVGIRDIAHLRAIQRERLKSEGFLQHRTRLTPKRAPELTDGGSIYWIIAGEMRVRQRLLGMEPITRDDGAAAVSLRLDPLLVPVEPRMVRAFQGWRYLRPEDAPPDIGEISVGADTMPETLQRALRSLALL